MPRQISVVGQYRILAILSLFSVLLLLQGCIAPRPENGATIDPPSLQLETAETGPESVLDDLQPGPVGDVAPRSYSMAELVAEIEEMQRRCQRGDEFRDDYRQRYRRLRQQLLDGATKEANDLRDAGQDPYEDDRVKYMHEALLRLP